MSSQTPQATDNGALHVGRVTEFDDHSGLGVVASDDGDEYPFHCIAIADGTRTIQVGTRVSFDVEFHVKRLEGVNLRPL
jgi:cold shock CspA family protein